MTQAIRTTSKTQRFRVRFYDEDYEKMREAAKRLNVPVSRYMQNIIAPLSAAIASPDDEVLEEAFNMIRFTRTIRSEKVVHHE